VVSRGVLIDSHRDMPPMLHSGKGAIRYRLRC
jgi:hypothetical protein